MKRLLIVLALLVTMDVYGAQEAVPKTENESEKESAEQSRATTEPELSKNVPLGDTEPKLAEPKTEKSNAAVVPKDTLDGTGLKNRKLSDVFEQFVPSESISADNAVPFPVDI